MHAASSDKHSWLTPLLVGRVMKCQGHKPTEADSSKKGVGSKKRGRGNGSSAKRASKVGVSAVYVAAVNGELTARAHRLPAPVPPNQLLWRRR